jgi:hypothetical protein
VGTGILAACAFIAVDYSRVRQVFLPESQRANFWPGDALNVAKSSLLFRSTADFAEFSLTPITPENAAHMLQAGQQMLHYSPEPKVIRKVIEAAHKVGDEKTAEQHKARMKVAFPSEPETIKPAQ